MCFNSAPIVWLTYTCKFHTYYIIFLDYSYYIPISIFQDEDEDLARALQLSIASNMQAAAGGGAGGTAAAPSAFSDPDFVSQLLSSADPNDPLIQAALAQLQQQQGNQPPPPPGGSNNGGDKDGDETGKKRKGDDV